MCEPPKPFLHVVKNMDAPPDELVVSGDVERVAREARLSAGHSADEVLGIAVTYAAMAWVACCMEQHGARVDVCQIAPGLFDATVYLSDDAGAVVGDITLRV